MSSEQTNIIIFSYNRACQVHACLESLYKHFKGAKESPVTVIWKASAEEFRKGYLQARKHFSQTKNLIWDEEQNFRAQTIKAVNRCSVTPSQFTMFLVDDIVFVEEVSVSDGQFDLLRNNGAMLGVSLRLHSGVTQCYATNRASEVPKFVKGTVWAWPNSQGDWGYPMSVDGNVYNTNYIKPLVETASYNNPNSFEMALDQTSKRSSVPAYMCCYPEGPRLINIPANRVQNQYQNRFAEGYSPEELNKIYLSGKVIDVDQYSGLKPNTVHVPTDIVFKDAMTL